MKSLKVVLAFALYLVFYLLVIAEGKNESSTGAPMESDIFANLDAMARKSTTPVNIEILRSRGSESSAQKVIFPSNSLQHVDRAYINKVVEANRILHATYSSNVINLAATIVEGFSNPLDYKLSRTYEDTLSVQQWIGILNRENPDLRMVCLDADGIGEKTVSLELASGSTIRVALNQLSGIIGVRWTINIFSTSKKYEISTRDNQEVQAVVEGPRAEIFFIKLSQSGMASTE